MGVTIPLDGALTSYLLEGQAPSVVPVRISVRQYPELNGQRPKAGHLIYVRTNSAERRVYSIVQFFGAMQFYCDLGNAWTGKDYAVIGTYDPITHEDCFQIIDPLDFATPERHLDKDLYDRSQNELMEGLRLELVALYGDQAPISLNRNA
jgi:hypothetical protein